MAQPRVLILRAPGTNCDVETAFAFERAGAVAERRHVNGLLESPLALADFQILCIPGGFSYGDDVAAGRILGNQIRHHLSGWLHEFHQAGKLILGICNGKFEDRWVPLVTCGRSVFFEGIETLYLPVAHAEGKFVPRDERILDALYEKSQIALRYGTGSTGSGVTMAPQVPYPDNPNGSLGDVAGVCDASGRICGLMPHPERHIDPTQHPRWTRRPPSAVGDGLRVFQNAVSYFG
jgi:phosphoribosylformylglycinamidine synthase